MVKPSRGIIGKGATYLYVETIISLIMGYLFWIVISKLSTTDTVGTSSAVITLAGIFSYIAIVGVDNGAQRFLGKSYLEQRIDDVKIYIKASLVLISVGIAGCSITILLVEDWAYDIFRIDTGLVIITIVIMASSTAYMFLYSVITASLNTKQLPKIMFLSSTTKIILAVILLLLGAGALGPTIGFVSNNILACILFVVIIFTTLKSYPSQKTDIDHTQLRLGRVYKNVIVSSMATWIPQLVWTLGSQLGVLIVFGSHGANQAGIYFICLVIVTAITEIMYSLFTIALPVLSAMKDGRKRLAWQTIRIGVIISLPLSSWLIFYSADILKLIDQDYAQGSLSLQILLTSMIPLAVIGGVNALAYSYGNYKHVLIIGLAMNLPRTILYFILVPMYDSTGAAISYTIGSVIGLASSVVVAKQIRMEIFWKGLVIMSIISGGIACLLSYLQINYIIGFIATILFSYIIFFKLRILSRSDIQDILAILPPRVSNTIVRLSDDIQKKLKGQS